MSHRLRVASYNIHKCKGLDRRTNPERIAKIIRELDADVVAIQEILDVRGGRPEYDQARCLAAELSAYRQCFGENRTLYGGRYGNMTLSRFPIQTCRNYDLTWRHRERRGCLRTDLLLPNNTLLHLFNVHLGTSFVERRHQARMLLSDTLLSRRDWARPRIVVGDFNEWTRGLASRLMAEAFEAAKPRTLLRHGRTYPGVFPVLHLDHFYYDKNLALLNFRVYRSRTALVASDHLPLIADMEVNLKS
ncbi:MAG TPA: endonuclease/exonuclease/phosphatase family protein [Terriglobales bacterium]|nr:endonuclease/exonuclease/phosphatase family protein [Terriglobales bacterium]